MAGNKKPAKKYRPKKILLDPVGYTLEGMTPISQHDSYLVDLKIKNHLAMYNLTRGTAARGDMMSLIEMHNMIEALMRRGFAQEYTQIAKAGYAALKSVLARGLKNGRFVLRGPEISALNAHMELHDAIMEVLTVRDIERALVEIRKEYALGLMENVIDLRPEELLTT